MAERSARDILNFLDYKSKFVYFPDLEIRVPETDQKGYMDKITFSFRNEELVVSDLFIAYAAALYQFTTQSVIASTVKVFGKLWPEKRIPKNATQSELYNRIKKMCAMGMLRRYVYELNGQNIVLFSTTTEGNRIIYQLLKLRTDPRAEKDLLPPSEIVSFAAASLICCELLKSDKLIEFRFMPSFSQEKKYTFYAEFVHITEQNLTIVQPIYTKTDRNRYTEAEWLTYQEDKMKALSRYIQVQEENGYEKIQLILVLQDKADFLTVSTWVVNIFPEKLIDNIYFTSEGALKSGSSLSSSLIRISKVVNDGRSRKVSAISSNLTSNFFK